MHKVKCAIRKDRMRPEIEFDETRTASNITSKAERRLLLSTSVAEDYKVKSWEIPVAYIKSPNNPRFRPTINQPPLADGSYRSPGKVCILRRAMPGDPSANPH